MENISESNQNSSISFDQEIWLVDTIINGVLALISAYVLVALLFYKIKLEQRISERFLRLAPEKRYGVLSTYLCIFIAVASLLCQTNAFARKWIERSLVYANLSDSQLIMLENTCTIIPPLGNFAITLGSGMVYTFLWLRQRVFYIHPSLKVLNSRAIDIFSLSIIILWFVFYVSLYFAYFSLVHYHYIKELGCVVEEYALVDYRQLISTWTIASIVMQIVLLTLFIYPILKRTLWKGQLNSDRNICLLKRVKKAVILTSVCLGSDIAAVVATVLLLQEDTSNVIFVYGVNLAINLLVTVACFDHWKKLLFPWHAKPETGTRTTSSVSNPPTRSYSKDLSVTDESHL